MKHFEFGTTTKQKHQDAATPPPRKNKCVTDDFALTSREDIHAAGVWSLRTVTLAAVGLVPGYICHVKIDGC